MAYDQMFIIVWSAFVQLQDLLNRFNSLILIPYLDLSGRPVAASCGVFDSGSLRSGGNYLSSECESAVIIGSWLRNSLISINMGESEPSRTCMDLIITSCTSWLWLKHDIRREKE